MRTLIVGMLVLTMSFCIVGNAQVSSDSAGAHKRTLYVVGVSHLDTQWRWTIKNTIDEYIPSTFHDNVKLMKLFPHYTFSFEGAFKYMLLKEYYPDD
jgi:alpha-mannosidase